ncbi:hypothetical protein BJ944DRAFT_154186 [Cunninghamella echinulata]|nr:hypothetical protein BJ944DRAFT_154186 [Cunninghamella echinulata]
MTTQRVGKYVLNHLIESELSKISNTAQKKPPQKSSLELTQQGPSNNSSWWKRKARPEDILDKREKKILKSVKSRAHFLDRGINCCCFQIGFDGLIGLIPIVGDFISLVFALLLIEKAMEARLPSKLINQMLLNVAVDFLIGLVPIVGDILDIMYKCNTQNAILLEEYLIQRQRRKLAQTTISNQHVQTALT